MKSDLPFLMEKHQLDGILVTGSGQHNPAMVYLTGGAHMTAEYIWKRGQEPVLFCSPMERQEAAKAGILVRSLGEYDLRQFLHQAQGDLAKALALRYRQMFQDVGLTAGRVAVYGRVEAGASYAVLNALQQAMPAIQLVGEVNDSMLMQARFTKDAQEIERIRRMGQITTQVMAQTAEFLTSHAVKDHILIDQDGHPLTVGKVKRQINLWLAEQGVENPLGGIFALGRESGIPHSVGDSSDLLRLGAPIVFDLYPCEAGGGYFYDCTRTWSLGYAPDALLALYEQVRQVYHRLRDVIKVGEPCSKYQKMVCEWFAQWGHANSDEHPNLQEGYLHALGHGVGLNIHERPWFGATATAEDQIVPGVVFTLEPGLYYPSQGLGVRLEDTLWVTPSGQVETLVEFPLDLVLPIGSKRT